MADEINKESWNNFILAHGGSFLQSWEWGEFQEHVGRRVFRFNGDAWRAQFIENKLPGVNKFYWHCSRGPVMANGEELIANSQLQEIAKKIKEAAGKDVIFFRLGQEWEIANRQSLIANRFQQLPYDIEPSQTLILDITKTEDELLAQMHEKWRYNIRLAERKGVQSKFAISDITNFDYYFDEFYRLVDKETSERKEIKHHPKEYYRKQLEINGENIKFNLFIAEYENKIIAANIVVIFLPSEALRCSSEALREGEAKEGGNRPADAKAMAGKATYLHGATSSEHREVMAPHLLQWEQIKYAKAQGCAEYDFWGIVNEHTLDKRGKSWEGFTRFKKGFGGKEVNYVGYWDYPLDKLWYFLYRLVQKFRR